MNKPGWRRAAVGLAVASTLGVGACASNTDAVGDPIAGKAIKPVDSSVLPGEVAGLKITPEDIRGQLSVVKRSFVDRVGLFSLRKGDLVVSTLQVSRFNSAAGVADPKFQASVLARVGATVPKLYVLSGREVFLTSGNKQTIAVWFIGHSMLVLAVRRDYPTPLGLVRQMLDVTKNNDKIA